MSDMNHMQMVEDSEELFGDEGHIRNVRVRRQCRELRETYIEIMGSKSDPTLFYVWQQFPDDTITITPIRLPLCQQPTTQIGQHLPPTTTK